MPLAKNTFWELVYHLNANYFLTQWKFKSSCKQNTCATRQRLGFLKSLFKEIFNLDFNFRKTLHHLFFWKISKVVSQARFRESSFFQLFVLRCKDWNGLHKHCHYFQAAEVSSMGMQACGLKGNLDCLNKIQQGRDNIVRVS